MNLAPRGPRTLRVAFAMGGGVSLGTFSGAALGEALKLLLAYATYTDPATQQPRRYHDVVVDAFSGASAGAMALGAMLRVLVNPGDFAEGGRPFERGLPTLADAQRAVDRDFACALSVEPPATRARLRAKLAAAQLVQDVQHYAWGREIGMDILLGLPQGPDPDRPGVGAREPADPNWARASKTAPSLLASDAVTRLAGRVLSLPSRVAPEFPLLGERVLYACSLASFVPLRADARSQLLRKGAGDLERWAAATGASSRPRRDVRVFDLYFNPDPLPMDASGRPEDPDAIDRKHPSRWVRYGALKQPNATGDLYGDDAWKRIGATAIACGAFPFALEPVTLRRFHFEMAEELPDLITHDPNEMYPFTYIDGGTFNNQPVREAFRLAGFLDALAPWGDYDRRVIHVTPNPSTLPPVLTVAALRDYTVQPVKRGVDTTEAGAVNKHVLARRSTVLRLFDQAGALLGAVLDQARSREQDRVAVVRDVFDRRRRLRRITLDKPVGVITDAAIKDLWCWCANELERIRKSDMIPPGTLTVEEELSRVAAELAQSDNPPRGVASLDADAVRGFARNRSSDPNAPLFFQLLELVALDIALDLAGKDELACLVSIAPIMPRTLPPAPHVGDHTCAEPAEPIALQESYRGYELPGGPIFGLMGFMIRTHRAHERDVARHSALRFLQWGGLLPPLPQGVAPAQPPRAFTRDELKQLDRMHDLLLGRVKSALDDAKELNIPCIGRMLIGGIVKKLAGDFEVARQPESITQDVVVRAVMSADVPAEWRITTERLASMDERGFAPIPVTGPDGKTRLELVAIWKRSITGHDDAWRWTFAALNPPRRDAEPDSVVITDAKVNRKAIYRLPTGRTPQERDLLRKLDAAPRPEIRLLLEKQNGAPSVASASVAFDIHNDVESRLTP